jgi:exonuclease SbcC
MIPIKLAIQGLYSYQNEQEIDFQRLIGSSVFGIFGKVGSGKTSLLEAISFALYGETERLNSRDNRQYNMMNLKSKQLRIDFEFRAGADQQMYKFVYEAKRHPKKHHEIGPGERRMFIREGNDWKPIGNEKEDVSVLSKQILGLDYENFKRTIIIPQNQFREFLELSPTDRTKMMNQLFKLDQYDLADRAKKLSDVNNDKLAELRGLLTPLETVTPEVIEQAKDHITAITASVQAKAAEIAQLEPDEQKLLQAQTFSQTLLIVQRELDGLETQEGIYQQLRQTLTLYETCRLVFQADFVNLRKLEDKAVGLDQARTKTGEQLRKITDQLPGIQSIYEATRKAYESRGQLLQQIDELDTVQTIRVLQESVGMQAKNRQQITLRLQQKREEISRYKAERQEHQHIIDQLLGQESKMERLYQAETWFAIYKPLKKQADELQRQVDDYDKLVEQIKQQKDRALSGFPNEWTNFTLKTLPAHIDKELAHLKVVRQEREEAHRQAFVKQELVRFADSLIDGLPCPLCGSEHHPDKHNSLQNTTHTDGFAQETKQALQAVNQYIEEATALRLTVEGLAKELRSTLDTGKRLTQERTETIRQLTEHEDQFIWHEFTKDDDDAITRAIRQESDQQKQLQQAQKAVQDITKQIDGVETAQRDDENAVNEIERAIAGVNGQLKTAIESLAYYRLAEVEQWDLVQVTDLRVSLTATYDQTKINFDAADKQKSETEKIQATLIEQFQQQANQLTGLTIEIQAIENTIAQNLAKHNLTRADVERILQNLLDVDQEKQRIKDYEEKRSGLRKQVSDLAKELLKHPFDATRLANLQQQLKQLRTEKDTLNKDLGKAGNVLATLERQWFEKETHQKRYDELDLRRQDLKKMDELFRAQGFVNYVSGVYLKNLCESANERFFKLTANQLKLELDEKNNFQVRDYLNGGEVRSVKTLSGGQTFQAALSLALALSDNIQQLTKAKQNLFFIDEGFGSLDKDSLQTVFKTLKALRSENRVVGIISHVEELQQEVDTYIRAEATEEGSRIRRSWEE